MLPFLQRHFLVITVRIMQTYYSNKYCDVLCNKLLVVRAVIKLICVILPNPKEHYFKGELFLLNFDAVNDPTILNSIFLNFLLSHIQVCPKTD
jgi:hypothetical protein